MKKFVILMLLIVTLATSFLACKSLNIMTGTGDIDQRKKALLNETGKYLPKTLENKELVIALNKAPDPQDTETAAFLFEQKYDLKIRYIQATWNQMQTKLVTSLTAGDPPDVVTFSQAHMPTFAIKELLQPITPHMDINDKYFNKNAMEEFKFKGQYYGIPHSIVPLALYYNKTMFENNGLKTPKEYYNEGKWNWETFKELGIALTQDTDRDGIIDQWGYDSSQPWIFMRVNGGEIVKYLDDGKVSLCLNEPQTVTALQFYQDIYSKYKFGLPNSNKPQQFIAGTTGMFAFTFSPSGGWSELANFKYEWDVVPIPIGPDGPKGVAPGQINCYGFANGAKNTKAGAAWIYFSFKYKEAMKGISDLKDPETGEEVILLSDEMVKLAEELQKNVLINKHSGIGRMKNLTGTMFKNLRQGDPLHTTIDKHSPIFQNEIDLLFD